MLKKANTPVVVTMVMLLNAALAIAQTNASKTSAVGTLEDGPEAKYVGSTASDVGDFEHHQGHPRGRCVARRGRGQRGQVRFLLMERPTRWHSATAERC